MPTMYDQLTIQILHINTIVNTIEVSIVYYIVLICWIAASLMRLLALRWSKKRFLLIDKTAQKFDTRSIANSALEIRLNESKAPFFVVFIPLLREQPMILEIINHFEKIVHEEGRMTVALVTTNREDIEGLDEQKLTTSDVVSQSLLKLSHISKKHIFKHYHTDGTDTCKGDQINQALKLFLAEFKCLKEQEVYVGVYDADSRPDPSTIIFLYDRIEDHFQLHKNLPPAFQQVPIYFNQMIPSWNMTRLFLNARVLHNLDFALTREFPAMQASVDYQEYSGLKSLLTAWLTHLIGHGEFIHLPILSRIGFFRAPSADTSLGYVLTFLNIPIIPIPLFDVSETPKNLWALVKQGAVWYRGVSLYWRDYHFSKTIGQPKKIRAMIMIIKVIYNNLAWSIFPLLVLISFSAALTSNSHPAHFLATIGILIYLIPNLIQMIDYPEIQLNCSNFSEVPKLGFAYRMAMICIYPFTKLYAMLGPWLYYFRILKESLGLSASYQKTERT